MECRVRSVECHSVECGMGSMEYGVGSVKCTGSSHHRPLQLHQVLWMPHNWHRKQTQHHAQLCQNGKHKLQTHKCAQHCTCHEKWHPINKGSSPNIRTMVPATKTPHHDVLHPPWHLHFVPSWHNSSNNVGWVWSHIWMLWRSTPATQDKWNNMIYTSLSDPWNILIKHDSFGRIRCRYGRVVQAHL